MTWSPRRIVYAVALVALLLVVLLVLGYCARGKRIAQVEDQATVADARTSSAAAAITALGQSAEADSQTRAEVQDAQTAIRQADPADRDAVARRELCKLQGRSPC